MKAHAVVLGQRAAWPGFKALTVNKSPGWIGPFSVVALTGTRPMSAKDARLSWFDKPLAMVNAG
jgi:hypothetical protein